MGLNSKGSYAKVWEATDMGKYKSCRVSISKKNRDTGEYSTDFSAIGVRFIGNASRLLDELGTPPFNVKITDFEVTTKYDKEKKREYTNYVVFNAEDASAGMHRNTVKNNDYENTAECEDDDSLPF